MKLLILALVLQACAVDGPCTVSWSGGASDSVGAVVCGSTISHPCPFMLYTTHLEVVGDVATWNRATGGVDSGGVAAEDRLPVVDTITFDADGDLVLPQRGDDGGLRLAATLSPTADGFAGDISWLLFNVPGTTTFHVKACAEYAS